MQQNIFSPIQLNFKEKQREFKKEFATTFYQKLAEVNIVAVGHSVAQIDYTLSETIAKGVIENILSNAVGGLPVIGPFAASFISTVPSTLYEKYKINQATSSAETLNT